MIFLIEYSRTEGSVVNIERFDDAQSEAADNARLDLELTLLVRHQDHEVVLLQAESEEALRKTHRRYFEDLQSIASSTGEESS